MNGTTKRRVAGHEWYYQEETGNISIILYWLLFLFLFFLYFMKFIK